MKGFNAGLAECNEQQITNNKQQKQVSKNLNLKFKK
jgi:hypothetical protein